MKTKTKTPLKTQQWTTTRSKMSRKGFKWTKSDAKWEQIDAKPNKTQL